MKKVYIVGSGSGNSGLITSKGLELIKKCDVLIYDRLVNDYFLTITKMNCEKIYVGKSNTTKGQTQDNINKIMVKKAEENKIVVRLKGGDPFLFGRGGEEVEYLRNNNIDSEITPGISACFGASAFSEIPLTHRNFSSQLHIFTGHRKKDKEDYDYEVISKLSGTIVFYMGMKNLEHVVGNLINFGMDKRKKCCIIENATYGNQKTINSELANVARDLKDSEIKPPAILIIGDVNNYLTSKSWFEKKQLINQKIVITRDLSQVPEFYKKLEELGAKPLIFPTIKIEFKNELFERDYKKISNANTVVFNSKNAVKSFMSCLLNSNYDLRFLANKKIAVMGNGTKEELLKFYLKTDYIPKKFTSKELIKLLIEKSNKNERIVFLTSNISNIDIDELNRNNDINFDLITCYDTKLNEYSKDNVFELIKEEPDIITFLSSSSVNGFFNNLNKYNIKIKKNLKFAVIGTVTKKTLESYGYKAEYIPDEFTINSLVKKIIENTD